MPGVSVTNVLNRVTECRTCVGVSLWILINFGLRSVLSSFIEYVLRKEQLYNPHPGKR